MCTIWWTTLLWCAIRNPFKCWFVHVERKCGHASMALLGHSVQFGFGYKLGQKIFCDGYMYIGHIKILEFV